LSDLRISTLHSLKDRRAVEILHTVLGIISGLFNRRSNGFDNGLKGRSPQPYNNFTTKSQGGDKHIRIASISSRDNTTGMQGFSIFHSPRISRILQTRATFRFSSGGIFGGEQT
jgi:hypothetical protein